jgi:hypothetical protein
MTTALASAWMPRGEINRFEKLLPILLRSYSGLAITLPPGLVVSLPFLPHDSPGVRIIPTEDWSSGRWSALKAALDFSPSHIHYVDFDRLLRWVERSLAEWQAILAKVGLCDYLLIGRSAAAYQTHPRALIETEQISNRVISSLIGQRVDASAGSKGFSRRAVEFILENCPAGHALGTDGEWTLALHRAGFRVDYIEADGLDWESADRYQDSAADANQQEKAARLYDQDVNHWQRRVAVADEVVEWALQAWENGTRTSADGLGGF